MFSEALDELQLKKKITDDHNFLTKTVNQTWFFAAPFQTNQNAIKALHKWLKKS